MWKLKVKKIQSVLHLCTGWWNTSSSACPNKLKGTWFCWPWCRSLNRISFIPYSSVCQDFYWFTLLSEFIRSVTETSMADAKHLPRPIRLQELSPLADSYDLWNVVENLSFVKTKVISGHCISNKRVPASLNLSLMWKEKIQSLHHK